MEHTETHNGCTIKIERDPDPPNPRTENDQLGKMLCLQHSRYSLGDKHSMSREEILDYVARDDVISLPLYLYDHSGLTMRTTPFSCPWDSGQVGFIAVTKERVRKEYGYKRVSRKLIKRVEGYLRNEVSEYDQYLTGEVYGYTVTFPDGTQESCWGFYGSDAALNEARAMADVGPLTPATTA